MRGENKIVINTETLKEAVQDYFRKVYAPEFVPLVEEIKANVSNYDGDTYEITVKESEKK